MTMEVRPYRLALQTPYRWSKGVQHHRSGLILRLQDGAHVGWGEAALPPHVDYAPDAFARECLALLAGLDPLADDFLHEVDLREHDTRRAEQHRHGAHDAGHQHPACVHPVGRSACGDHAGEAPHHGQPAERAAQHARAGQRRRCVQADQRGRPARRHGQHGPQQRVRLDGRQAEPARPRSEREADDEQRHESSGQGQGVRGARRHRPGQGPAQAACGQGQQPPQGQRGHVHRGREERQPMRCVEQTGGAPRRGPQGRHGVLRRRRCDRDDAGAATHHAVPAPVRHNLTRQVSGPPSSTSQVNAGWRVASR